MAPVALSVGVPVMLAKMTGRREERKGDEG